MLRHYMKTLLICGVVMLCAMACSKKSSPETAAADGTGDAAKGAGKTARPSAPVDITIGTGQEGGAYFSTGHELIKLLKDTVPDLLEQCTVQASAGSVDNINNVLKGKLTFALAQSDQQYAAVQGQSAWADAGPQANLRALFSVYPEAVTIISRDEAAIRSVDDLRGKNVNVGEPGSGTYQNAMDVLAAAGLSPETDLEASQLSTEKAVDLLKSDMLDAIFLTTGHPSDVVQGLLESGMRIRLVPFEGLAALQKQRPYYVRAVIPLDLYPDVVNSQDINTVGVQATVVTSADLPDDLAYGMAKAFIDNLETFRTINPVYRPLTYASALQSLSAPLHPGAIRYYTEVAPMILEKSHKHIVGR